MWHRLSRRRALAATAVLGAALWTACTDQTPDSILGPDPGLEGLQVSPGIEGAITAQQRHTPGLLAMSGVVGTAVSRSPEGEPRVLLFLEAPGTAVYPAQVDGIPVEVVVSGRFMAGSDPTTRERPAPVGFSVGHPQITAGTIGARVVDGDGNVFILSNNHVLANSNDATLGDPTLQPGPADGGSSADRIGTLAGFKAIDFTSNTVNEMDAAIARVTDPADLSRSTPADDGYGVPNSRIFGDANGDGLFDSEADLLQVNVQKYGRTTKLTKGEITGINATVEICYEVWYIWCVKSAVFTDQLVVEPGGFSSGGDSGSLIVTDDEDRNPVALLFAGSQTQTIANRIDLVLRHFGVTVDGEDAEPPPPPDPVTDVAIADVSAPGSAVRGETVDVTVTVENTGNQDVGSDVGVTLTDETDGSVVGTQTVAGGLGAGASTTLTYSWDTGGSTIGAHTLTASHDLADDDGGNDEASATIRISEPSTGIHVGDLDGWSDDGGYFWSATVEVTVHDGDHQPVNGARVVGGWSPAAFYSDQCDTGEGGGIGTCIFLNTWISRRYRSTTFTVADVSLSGETYDPSANHDPDGGSDGTSITVNRP